MRSVPMGPLDTITEVAGKGVRHSDTNLCRYVGKFLEEREAALWRDEEAWIEARR